ncbi:MAG: hypothetical protein IKE85_01920 [Mogibacterium sp.]|nr:hypothetical protein [Mogibacterium sp.]
MKIIAKILGSCIGILAVCHTAEWFLEGRKVAKAAGIPVSKALPLCLLKGFVWWKPLKKELDLNK